MLLKIVVENTKNTFFMFFENSSCSLNLMFFVCFGTSMFFSPSFLEQKFLITLFFCILELKSPILSFSFSGILFQYNGFFYIDLSLPLFSWFFRRPVAVGFVVALLRCVLSLTVIFFMGSHVSSSDAKLAIRQIHKIKSCLSVCYISGILSILSIFGLLNV